MIHRIGTGAKTIAMMIAVSMGTCGVSYLARAEPYDQCGVYVQGPEGCILFHPDNGGLRVLPELPPPAPGTRARVRGDEQQCASFCFVNCIFGAVVTQCPGACRPDFDGNGTLNAADIFAFLSAWFAGNAAADFDLSGSLAVADIFAFVSAWFVGC